MSDRNLHIGETLIEAIALLNDCAAQPFFKPTLACGSSRLTQALEQPERSGTIDVMRSAAIEKQALELPAEKRAALAQRLLESLDDLSAAEAEQLWLLEAARRAREIDTGKAQVVSAAELERRVKARYV